MYSFSIVVIENLYIQTSLMVALSLFRVKEGGPIYKSEVDIIGNFIIPTDFHSIIFQRGRSTTNQLWFYIVPCFSREQLADLISDTWLTTFYLDYEYPGRQKGVLRQYNPATHRIHVWYIC